MVTVAKACNNPKENVKNLRKRKKMVKGNGPTKLQSSKRELRALDINGQHVLKSSDKCLAQQSLRVLYPTYTLGFLFLTLSKIFGLCSTFEDVEINIFLFFI